MIPLAPLVASLSFKAFAKFSGFLAVAEPVGPELNPWFPTGLLNKAMLNSL